MTKYHPTQHCVKCGSHSHDIEWKRPPDVDGQGRPLGASERLIVTCRGCGYVATFLPLDAKESE